MMNKVYLIGTSLIVVELYEIDKYGSYITDMNNRFIYNVEIINRKFGNDLKFLTIKTLYYDKFYNENLLKELGENAYNLYIEYGNTFVELDELLVLTKTYANLLNIYYNGEGRLNNG